MSTEIPFNRPYVTGAEIGFLADAMNAHHLSGDGDFTRRCSSWLERRTTSGKALLTHSCTAALEMAAFLCEIEPGDEVIMPSYTFVSTANAFVLRGAIPVFVDVRPDTFNMDEALVEGAITGRTKAIVPVHYAGVGCEMDVINRVADAHGLAVIEDAAQGVLAFYKGRALGSLGSLGALSFHETKNIISGEGGALLINDAALEERAEIIREKGTNRSQFFRGQVDKYTWVDVGSSYLPSDLSAAFLWAQMGSADAITAGRRALWGRYHEAFARLEGEGVVRRPIVPRHCAHNAHMYYLLLPDLKTRTAFIAGMAQQGVSAVFHYVPLHSAPAGLRYGRAATSMTVTDDVTDRLVRLPLWAGLEPDVDRVVSAALGVLGSISGRS